MNERFIYLIGKKLDNEITATELKELNQLIESNEDLKREYEKQFNIKEVMKNMTLKNPPTEIWDSYWVDIYNRVERGIAWLITTIGALIIIGYGAITAAEEFLKDNQSPLILKIGIAALLFGVFFLFFSVIREKYFTRKHDKYKEIQR